MHAQGIYTHVFLPLMGGCLSVYLEGPRKTIKRPARSVQANCLFWNMRSNKLWTGHENTLYANFDVLLTVHLSIFISVINQLDAQNFCFIISLFHASTCFEHMCSKHVEAWNKHIVKQKFCASSWLITDISMLYAVVVTVRYILIYLICWSECQVLSLSHHAHAGLPPII